MKKQIVCQIGEEIAASFLEKKGFLILERNWHLRRWGELDIIAQDGDVLVFVEVKTRLGTKFGNPEEAVNFYKKKALWHSAQYYKTTHGDLPDALRIDVVSILLDPETQSPLKIQHFPNIDI